MNTVTAPVLFSLKPRYADLIFQGIKKAELRRRIMSHVGNRSVYVYVSSPIRELRGGFRVGQVWRGEPEKIWEDISELASVDKGEFDAYFGGRSIAFALEITDVWKYGESISLSTLRKEFANFSVPRSWRYVKPEEQHFFRFTRESVRFVKTLDVKKEYNADL